MKKLFFVLGASDLEMPQSIWLNWRELGPGVLFHHCAPVREYFIGVLDMRGAFICLFFNGLGDFSCVFHREVN